jgi:hypothetical protein
MERLECEFEAAILAAQPFWPEGADAELRAHSAACPICAETVRVAGALADAAAESRAELAAGVLPDAGLVWWRAQMRARREAALAAGRPITAMQVLAFAAAMGLAGACFGATSTWFQEVLQAGIAAFKEMSGSELAAALGALAAEHAVALVAAGAVLLLTPVALLWVASRES